MAKQLSIGDRIRKEYPEAYKVPGVGWCGPQWEAAAALERALLDQRVEDESLAWAAAGEETVSRGRW